MSGRRRTAACVVDELDRVPDRDVLVQLGDTSDIARRNDGSAGPFKVLQAVAPSPSAISGCRIL